jgi:hypothetical protein
MTEGPKKDDIEKNRRTRRSKQTPREGEGVKDHSRKISSRLTTEGRRHQLPRDKTRRHNPESRN